MGDISRHFSRHEFACKCGCGLDAVDARLLEELERIRRHFGRPVHITSGCRCKERNAEVGGAPDSQHTFCKAADFVVEGIPPWKVADTIEPWHVKMFGIGRYEFHTHLDVRDSPSRWNLSNR